jgi:glycosyltransferase EpsD
MPQKILFISTIAIFSRFNLPFMRWFKEQGWQVDYVSDGEIQIPDCDNQYTIPIKRSPYNLKNIKAYKELKIILLNDYDIIHCHTPMGGVLGRLAAKNIKTRAKILYTAHGFHFYKGAPIINWLIYYPIEKYLSKYTDTIITINKEDYNYTRKTFSNPERIRKINGIGVNLEKFTPCDENIKIRLRNEMGYSKEDFIIIYIAEFTIRKNHILLLKAINSLKRQIPSLKILFAGIGPLLEKYKTTLEESNFSEIIDFLGYRNDIDVLCKIADIAVSPSKQEGLPIGIIESIASGLPIVCSKIRGHTDVIINEYNGFLFDIKNHNQMIDNIIKLFNNKNLRYKIAQNNIKDAQKYSLDTAINKMASIYKQFM